MVWLGHSLPRDLEVVMIVVAAADVVAMETLVAVTVAVEIVAWQ